MANYIKLMRQLEKWEWYSNPNTKAVFIHLLLRAQWKASKYQGVNLRRGQLLTTYSSIAKANGLTYQEARTAITHLKSTDEITVNVTGSGKATRLVITIKNYGKYQSEQQINQQTEYKQSNNIQESKEEIAQKEDNSALPKAADILYGGFS